MKQIVFTVQVHPVEDCVQAQPAAGGPHHEDLPHLLRSLLHLGGVARRDLQLLQVVLLALLGLRKSGQVLFNFECVIDIGGVIVQTLCTNHLYVFEALFFKTKNIQGGDAAAVTTGLLFSCGVGPARCPAWT